MKNVEKYYSSKTYLFQKLYQMQESHSKYLWLGDRMWMSKHEVDQTLNGISFVGKRRNFHIVLILNVLRAKYSK